MKPISKVEQFFKNHDYISKYNENYRKIPTIIVDNYAELGKITALRFLEWACEHPGESIALPTGKTPEFFIKWVQYFLNNWNKEQKNGILHQVGLIGKKPDMQSFYFFQIDEFFPIDPDHERSFQWFIRKFYIKGFGLDPNKVHFIDTYHIPDLLKKQYKYLQNTYQVFNDQPIDLTLRIRQPANNIERIQKSLIQYFDDFCQQYEEKIRSKGGIGFFLGGIGPDGHIAFNIRGSNHFSHTRLTAINYETQAAAATDMGGIEVVRKKAVITIGLSTITYNSNAVAIIIAAGQAKAKIVAQAIENEPSVAYPATALQKLPNARFYITKSAASWLTLSDDSILYLNRQNLLPKNFLHHLIISNLTKTQKSIATLINNKPSEADAKYFKIIKQLTQTPLNKLGEELYHIIHKYIQSGLNIPRNMRIMHTAPHHDDIELAYFPLLHHLVRSEFNENYFVYCTSGFTAVTNQYILDILNHLSSYIEEGIFMHHSISTRLNDFNFASDDITGYLNAIAQQNTEQQQFYTCSRIARQLIQYNHTNNFIDLKEIVNNLITIIQKIEPGRKEPEIIHLIKGWIREFEAELVWAHFGIDMNHVHHLRLPFYSDDIFPQYPSYEYDVKPIFTLIEKIKPNIITIALDPEGSGPDTHFKTLIALSEAIDKYVKTYPDINLKIWGYRNIWSRFQLHEASLIFPTSLNSFAVLHNMFNNCFLSQKSASFPSYEHDGTFSELAQKIWVEQFDLLVKLLGKDYFYESTNPMLRRAYGAIFIKEMSYASFNDEMANVRRLLETKNEMNSSSYNYKIR